MLVKHCSCMIFKAIRINFNKKSATVALIDFIIIRHFIFSLLAWYFALKIHIFKLYYTKQAVKHLICSKFAKIFTFLSNFKTFFARICAEIYKILQKGQTMSNPTRPFFVLNFSAPKTFPKSIPPYPFSIFCQIQPCCC